MAYNRQPQTVIAGSGLKQSPSITTLQPAGIIPVTLDAEIATTTGLGVVQVGSGLVISPAGVLSTTGTGLINVKLVTANYTALDTDYYIGANKKEITVTLPLGIAGKVYIVKNQVSGEITVTGTGGQKIDSSTTKSLGTNDSVIVVFDGARWEVI